MATIPNTDSGEDSWGPKGPASASNGMPPGTAGRLLKGQGAIGGAQEAAHQPRVVPHPQGPFVDREGNRYKVDSC